MGCGRPGEGGSRGGVVQELNGDGVRYTGRAENYLDAADRGERGGRTLDGRGEGGGGGRARCVAMR